jgi:nucleoside phosphorylase
LFCLLSFCFGLLPLPAREIAYFYALDADLAAFQKEAIVLGEPKTVSGQKVTTLRIGPNVIRAAKMGSGCIQSAVTAATVLSRFPCDLALSTGPVGRLSDELKLKELIYIEEVTSYQMGSETTGGFVTAKDSIRELDNRDRFPLPQPLAACQATRLASGELFLASDSFRATLRSSTQAKCVDMNLAGLALACSEARVPLLAWKVISDSANHSASTDFQAFVKSYSGDAGKLMAELVKALPPDLNEPGSHSHLNSLLNSSGGK